MKKTDHRVVITHSAGAGGVAFYYQTLRRYLPASYSYQIIHHPKARTLAAKLWYFPGIYLRFLRQLAGARLLICNPSLNRLSFYRDMLFIWSACRMGKKVVVFFRGWEEGFEHRIYRSAWLKRLFLASYARADRFIVLGRLFQNKLYRLGVPESTPIHIETTLTDERFFRPPRRLQHVRKKSLHCLFLSRLVKGKGLHSAITLYQYLKVKCPQRHVSLTIVGDGPERAGAESRIRQTGLADVVFTGYLRGEAKARRLAQADVLLLPSRTEGLPNTILEAMLYGLFIVTTAVGGIPDIVREGVNGVLIDRQDLEEAANRITAVIACPGRLAEIAQSNGRMTRQNFTPARVAARYQHIVNATLQDGRHGG